MVKNGSRPVRALGLCSGGLDSMLAALVLRDQGIDVTWISFSRTFPQAPDRVGRNVRHHPVSHTGGWMFALVLYQLSML